MLTKFAMLLSLSCIFVASTLAQGLTTQASKDDWEEINFEFNSAVLSDGYPSLLCLADKLRNDRNLHVKVEGNTDNIGSERVNEKLGLARANTVKNFLVKYGADASQVDVGTRGKRDPKYPGFKPGYSRTDVARWMNRRVVLTVTDASGKTVPAGCVEPKIVEKPVPGPNGGPNCCDDILKRLDDIAGLLRDLKNENTDLRNRISKLETGATDLNSTIRNLPKPPTPDEINNVIEKNKDPRFALMGLNVGADNDANLTFTGSGRFFAPMRHNFAVQIQGEYMYFHDQREGQADIGLVNRIGPFQAGIFGSFKNVWMKGEGSGTIGQGAAVLEYLFGLGKVGIFGTKSFLNDAVLSTHAMTFTDAFGNTVIAPNLYSQRYLHVDDQIGINGTVALFGRNYLEGNVGYVAGANDLMKAGGTVKFVFPLSNRFAVTVEGGFNETMIMAKENNGRAVVGFEVGNFLRPKQFLAADHPVPMQVPRVRYEVLSRTIQRGVSPPVADAGPDQLGIPAGTVTLNGSNSRDPNGETLTYQWVQESGPAVALQNANQPIATFTAVAGQQYSFRLTVRNTDGQSASARTRVTTVAVTPVEILFFTANPTNINAGQASQLSWRVTGATSVTISPGIGAVNPTNGQVSVSPTTTTTYTLTATGPAGTQNATATVMVNTPKAQILVCTASPMNIISGESSTIVYQTLNADTVTITPGVGNVGKSGNIVVSPTVNTNYTITATNAFGSTTCSVAIQVGTGPAPRIVRFTASPLTIGQGGTSTLLWAVDNADTVTISSIGQVDNRAGTRDVSPTLTTTYTLTATNRFASMTATVTVNVIPIVVVPPPVITSFTANPSPSPAPGTAVTLNCQATNAKQIVISGVGPLSSGGTLVVNPLTTTTYVCVAVGPTGLQASSNLTVPVTPGH